MTCARPPTRWTRSATPPRPLPRAMPSARPVWVPWCCSRPIPRDIDYFISQGTLDVGGSVDFARCPIPTSSWALIIGGLLPYLFGAMGMTGRGPELRRRGRSRCAASSSEIEGIMEGTGKPEYWALRGPSDQGGDQGDDHPLDAAGSLADRALLRDSGDRRSGGRPRSGRRHAARCDRDRAFSSPFP